MDVWYTQSMCWDSSSFTWHKICNNSTYVLPFGGYSKHTVKGLQSLTENHLWQECSESAWEQRICQYKSDQPIHIIVIHIPTSTTHTHTLRAQLEMPPSLTLVLYLHNPPPPPLHGQTFHMALALIRPTLVAKGQSKSKKYLVVVHKMNDTFDRLMNTQINAKTDKVIPFPPPPPPPPHLKPTTHKPLHSPIKLHYDAGVKDIQS